MYGTYKDVHSAPTSVMYSQFLYLHVNITTPVHRLAMVEMEGNRQEWSHLWLKSNSRRRVLRATLQVAVHGEPMGST